MPGCQRSHPAVLCTDPFDEAALRHYFGRRLQERRKALGLTQPAVARQMGTTKSTISAIEGGRRPLTVRVLQYAHLLQLPYAALFPPTPETPLERRIRRLLAAPSYVHALFDSILDMPSSASPAWHSDAS